MRQIVPETEHSIGSADTVTRYHPEMLPIWWPFLLSGDFLVSQALLQTYCERCSPMSRMRREHVQQ